MEAFENAIDRIFTNAACPEKTINLLLDIWGSSALLTPHNKFRNGGHYERNKRETQKLCIKTGDEIAVLAAVFNSMTQSLRQYIYSLTAVTAEKKRIGTEQVKALIINRKD